MSEYVVGYIKSVKYLLDHKFQVRLAENIGYDIGLSSQITDTA